MAAAFPAPPGKFVGRDEYIARFRARVEHFSFFIYEGIAGVGKTALALRLAKEAKTAGVTNAVYLVLWPGETINSILGRVEARFRRLGSATEHQGDPYARLIDLLDTEKAVLILNRIQNLRREDVPALCRAFKARPGRYKVIALSHGDPELSAMDRVAVHLERLGPLTVEEVIGIAASRKADAATRDILVEDAKRGGCVCHPLTLHFLLGLCGNEPPSLEFLATQTARSVNAFRALLAEVDTRWNESERAALTNLMRVGLPITKPAAQKAFGAAVQHLINRRLVDVIDGEVYAHSLISQVMNEDQTAISLAAAKVIAKHLQTRATARGEPMLVIRAGELLARAGSEAKAVDTLASGWESVRDLGFLEAYLKTLSSIKASGVLGPRVKLLSARARMRKGNPAWVKAEMEALANQRDMWTRIRAFAALTYIHSAMAQPKSVVKSYDALRKLTSDGKFTIPTGVMAASAMVRVGRVADAEKLAKSLLAKLPSKKQDERKGELHRLLARIYAQSGRLETAVKQGHMAAKAFEAAGDLYHAATAYGFVGDLYRETGDFELAKEAFKRFYDMAKAWGDRDLIQIAELADAWVSLDIGDLAHAAQQIATVEKDMSAAASKRLRRYLAAARALLEAGRGHHKEAASQLSRVVEAWEQAGQRAIADILRAQLVRSQIACGDLDQAEAMVKLTLKRLDAKTAAPRVASFLRESALIRLRRKDVNKAMAELSQARRLFSKGGNRREEALTLHRIAHAALEEGDLELAKTSAREALVLARSIKHARAMALARELQGRVALASGQASEAMTALKEAAAALRRLGDEVGTLHIGEWLLRAQIFSGDLAAAIRQGPKVRAQADKLGIDEVRLRAMALSGVAFLRRSRLDAASRCLIEPVDGQTSPVAVAMMWRFGEALAAVSAQPAVAAERRAQWVSKIRSLPDHRQAAALYTLEQLGLPPRERCRLRTHRHEEIVGTEGIGWLAPADYDLVIDLLQHEVYVKGTLVTVRPAEVSALLDVLTRNAPGVTPFADIYGDLFGEEAPPKPDKRLRSLVGDLKKLLRKARGATVEITDRGVNLTGPPTFAFLVPTELTIREISDRQREIIRALARMGSAPLQVFQEQYGLTRTAARRELAQLIDLKLVEVVRDGRGQAFRLA